MFMKQKILLAVLSLLCATFAKTATIDVKTNLWTGIQEVTDAWGGAQAIGADKLSQVAAGLQRVLDQSQIRPRSRSTRI